MISIKTLKEYEFETIEMYFDYIVDSYKNGQLMQVCDLCNDLSKKQKLHCLNYLQNNYGSTEAILYVITKLI